MTPSVQLGRGYDSADIWRAVDPQAIPATLPLPWAELCGMDPCAAIVDLGCGYGRFCREMNGRGFRNVTGIDINARAIEAALISDASGGANYLVGDARDCPLPDAAFDAATMVALLTTAPEESDRIAMLQEAHRMLRRGGVLVVTDMLQMWQRPHQRERYESGLARGYAAGCFDVNDANGDFLYRARHFTEDEAIELGERSGFEVQSFRRSAGVTRSGRPADVFVMAARKK